MTDLTNPAEDVDAGGPTVSPMREGSHPVSRPPRRLIRRGLVGAVVAVAATSLTAAVARTMGVDFELPDGGQELPVSGIGTMTGIFAVAGLLIAAAFRRWSRRPAPAFAWTTVILTAVSLIPPFLAGANVGTVTSLVLVHLLAAAVMIPVLTRELRR